MSDIVFENVRLIDPASGRDETGRLVVRQGRIVACEDGSVPEGARVIDGAGAVLCPGLVDMRVALGEPGSEYRESVSSGARAAVAGGITTMAVLPNTSPRSTIQRWFISCASEAKRRGWSRSIPMAR